MLPNGVDTLEFRPSATPPTGDIVFVGGHTWFPNSDGMEYFARAILPIIRKRLPDISVTWVGRASTEIRFRFEKLGVTMTGYVEDIRPFVYKARCNVVPLRIGGGTRLKILDAWALGKAVVATPVGCEGLSTADDANILIRESPEAFASAVVDVLSDSGLRTRLERGGRATAEDEYDWRVLAAKMLALYHRLDTHPPIGHASQGAYRPPSL